jgi:hypothetical protein
LAYIHYLRKAFTDQGAASVAVTEAEGKFTPHFDGKDWWHVRDLSTKNLYNSYPLNADTTIMDGITISKHSTDPTKYVIEYTRALTVSRPVWQNNTNGDDAPFIGFGLKKGVDVNISVFGSGAVQGGRYFDTEGESLYSRPVVNDFATYETALEEAGLHPSDGVLLNHSRVKISSAGTGDTNVMSNGMYDFILAYYNPASDYDGSDAGTEAGKARLPSWLDSGLTFDGLALPDGVASRNIGGAVANSMSRKGDARTSGVPASYASAAGEPRADFVNSITVPMANYMVSNLHISEFKNTNIIGDGDKWSSIAYSNLSLIPTTNVGLIGDYSNIGTLGGIFKGVTDIKGKTPTYIGQDDSTVRGYIDLWHIQNNMGINNFYVISIKDLDGIQYFNKDDPGWSIYNPANVVIYPKKYGTSVINGESVFLKPKYRAFLDGPTAQTGTPKIMPVDSSFTDSSYYKGTVVSASGAPNVYPLDEASWINAANNNGAAPAVDTYSNAPKLNATSFGSISVSAAP